MGIDLFGNKKKAEEAQRKKDMEDLARFREEAAAKVEAEQKGKLLDQQQQQVEAFRESEAMVPNEPEEEFAEPLPPMPEPIMEEPVVEEEIEEEGGNIQLVQAQLLREIADGLIKLQEQMELNTRYVGALYNEATKEGN